MNNKQLQWQNGDKASAMWRDVLGFDYVMETRLEWVGLYVISGK